MDSLYPPIRRFADSPIRLLPLRSSRLCVKKAVVKSTIGFRVKSGWATAVLLTGPAQSPQLLDHRVIDLCDPDVPESRQPYHARMGTLEEDEAKIKRRVQIVRRATNQSVTQLLKSYREMGHEPGAAGLVVGSIIDPTKISNTHIRAHALEGRLFRTTLEDAVKSHGLSCVTIVERTAYAQAAAALGRTDDQVRRAVAEFGRSLPGGYRADDKLAVVGAWVGMG